LCIIFATLNVYSDMKKLFYIVIIIFAVNVSLYSQNVGQPGNDSIVNYTDIQGNRQGKWIRKYDKDKVAYIGYFKNNKLVGTYKRWYYSGALKAEIRYNNDGSVGYAKLYWDDGKIMSKGKYINQNVKDSIWEYYGTDGALLSKESYNKGVLNGNTYDYFRDGSLSKLAPYVNGKLHGIYKEYWETVSRVRLEIAYKNGVRLGAIKVYFDDGKPYLVGNYVNDLPDGKWTVYTQDGKVDKELEYINGRLKDEDKYDKEFTKKVMGWDKMKGKIPEPSDEEFFDPKQKSQMNQYDN